MRALLLAAGLGTRLRPLTDTVPKCLVPIRGRPLLGLWFDLLFRGGIERALVNMHHHADAVRDFIDRSPWRDRVDTVHEERLLGTGGTALRNRAWLGSATFMLVHADNLSRFPVGEFVAAHRDRPPVAAITMLTFDTDDPRSCGIVELDTHGLVQRFHEKVENPQGTHANGAVYIVELEVLEFLAGLGREVVDFSTEVLPAYLGRIATYHNPDYHRDIGTPAALRKAEIEFAPP